MTLSTDLKALIAATEKEADDIRYYSGGSSVNQSKDQLADWVLANSNALIAQLDDNDDLVAIVSSYADRIKNGRTKDTVYDAIDSELHELRFEIDAENHDELEAGPDGIFGECIDIIASTLDLIRMEYPDIPVTELRQKCADYMRLKCDKWERKYG